MAFQLSRLRELKGTHVMDLISLWNNELTSKCLPAGIVNRNELEKLDKEKRLISSPPTTVTLDTNPEIQP